MNSISPSAPVTPVSPVLPNAPKLVIDMNSDVSNWRRIASIIAVVAITVLAFSIALGVCLTASVFVVIGAKGAASITIGSTIVALGISLLVRHIINKKHEQQTPNDTATKPPQEPNPPVASIVPPKVDIQKPAAAAPVVAAASKAPPPPAAPQKQVPDATPQKPAITVAAPPAPPKTPPPTQQQFTFSTPTKPAVAPAPMATPTKTPVTNSIVPPSPSSKISTKAAQIKALREQNKTVKSSLASIANNTSLSDEDKAKAYFDLGDRALGQKDYKGAITAFEEAAKLEHDKSMYELGKIYFSGEGDVEEDINKALIWYNSAHDLGNNDATKKLANIYKKGLGVPIDTAKADEYLAELVPVKS